MLFIAPYSTCMVKNKYSFFHTVIWVFILRNTLSLLAIFLHTLSHCIFHNRQSSRWNPKYFHYSDVIMSVMTSQIPGVSLVQTFLSVSVVCVCVCVFNRNTVNSNIQMKRIWTCGADLSAFVLRRLLTYQRIAESRILRGIPTNTTICCFLRKIPWASDT